MFQSPSFSSASFFLKSWPSSKWAWYKAFSHFLPFFNIRCVSFTICWVSATFSSKSPGFDPHLQCLKKYDTYPRKINSLRLRLTSFQGINFTLQNFCCQYLNLKGKTLLAKNGRNSPKFVVTWYKFTFIVVRSSTPARTTIWVFKTKVTVMAIRPSAHTMSVMVKNGNKSYSKHDARKIQAHGSQCFSPSVNHLNSMQSNDMPA